MKIIMCTTPIRPVPTGYPPFGSMTIIQSLREEGYDPYFYDIDGLRPEFDEVVRFFESEAPDVIGISAVVSTAYAYTKRLALAIREVCPKAKIVVGGNLAASAELLVRKCGVDVCGIGEGEKVMVRLVRHWEDLDGREEDYSRLKEIKSITFLDQDDQVHFTGYDVAIAATDFAEPDFEILEKYSRIENYIVDPLDNYTYAQDPRSHEPHRRGKKASNVITAKGCVARCTFCHRWDRGYRHMSIDSIINKVQYLIDRYNVGFVDFADENFGSDRRKLDELLERLKPLDILWYTEMRCKSVDPDLLRRMKESGCVGAFYGIESGSQRMLDIMEKNSALELNVDVCRWTHEAGIYTVYQLILGMPGEDHQTVAETGRFLNSVTEYLSSPPNERLSINYIQALPGTAVYEYARSTGLIGPTLDDEEEYLIRISDTNAVDDVKTLNFTQYDYLTMQSWRPRLVFNAEANWYQKRGWKPADPIPEAILMDEAVSDEVPDNDFERGGYFRLGHIVYRNPKFYRLLSMPLLFPLRMMYPAAYVLIHDYRVLSKRRLLGHIVEFLKRKVIKRQPLKDFISLRKVMEARTPEPVTKSDESMLPLRSGR